MNFSRPGWSTEQEWMYGGHQLKGFNPDLMIIGFCLNDAEQGAIVRKRLLEPTRRHHARSSALRWLIDHSALAKTLFQRTENIRQRQAARAYYPAIYDDSEGWSGCVKSLERFRGYAVNHQIPLLLVVFPVFDGQIDAGYPYREIHELIRETGNEIGITVLDLLPTFAGMDARRLAVEPFTDPHPNELAHRIAADTLLNFLIRHDWLPLLPEDSQAPGRCDSPRNAQQ